MVLQNKLVPLTEGLIVTTTDTESPDLGTEDWSDLQAGLDSAGIDALSAVEQASAAPPPDLEEPLDGPVRLPGGFRRFTGAEDVEDITEAWVRELNGADEERIAKARLKGNTNAVIETILEAGVEKLGEEPPRKGELLDLLAGDRDFLLLEISRATFGETLEWDQVVCSNCHEAFGVELGKSEDIPVKRLDDLSEAYFDVKIRGGHTAHVRLTTGRDLKALGEDKTPAEMNSILLQRCVETITNKDESEVIVADVPDWSRKLGSRDRETILTEIGKRSPGPQYNEVRFKHEPGCGFELTFAVGLMELFRGL